MLKKALFAAALLPLAAACADSTASGGDGRVAVRFNAVAAGAQGAQALFDHVPATGAITLTGTNGTLVLQDIRLIVSELELERANASCRGEDDDDDCEEFEGGPFLVNLLDGTAAEVVNASIPAGSYSEFEFEVEDLDADEDDDGGERQAIQSILAGMRQAYPGFPSDASMVVHGTFTPTGGTAQKFTVYFEAEIEVEHKFATPFRVPEDGAIEVNLDPALWFKPGAQVVNLAALNGRTVEFEAEFKSGIKVEHDDD
ncbi:MAG: hypothetical protein AVDCRST_MAG68-455 [uncultured Gemmatimonadetes bacterium]|uniref:DUF4382 domain-containing protein n=1 Tax=uncultured Gemmatimonadota bacterium TaxID=203437 RepID=A0A6J4KCG9_9BACT|nr:MAG: hypothetical protein AVDCRST_MAG68-455 [uncultured Gemmatimonadota bacterium]